MKVHLTEDELVLYRYQESPDAAAVEHHLHACPQCQADYASLERVLGVLDAEMPEPPISYERDVWARLQTRLAQETSVEAHAATGLDAARLGVAGLHSAGAAVSALDTVRPEAAGVLSFPRRDADAAAMPGRSWAGWFVPQLALAATIALLLAGSFAIDRVVHTPASSSHVPTIARSGGAATPSAPNGARARVLFAAVGDHLQRSELMLTELNNADTEGVADWSEQQAWAEDLVSENRLYRQSAADAGDAQVLGLLDDLERVLIEVAHTPATPPAGELERLRERLDTQDLLFKVRVTGAGLRARGEMAAVLDSPLDHTGSGL